MLKVQYNNESLVAKLKFSPQNNSKNRKRKCSLAIVCKYAYGSSQCKANISLGLRYAMSQIEIEAKNTQVQKVLGPLDKS